MAIRSEIITIHRPLNEESWFPSCRWSYIRLDQFIINLLDDIMSSIFIGTFLNFYYFTLEKNNCWKN